MSREVTQLKAEFQALADDWAMEAEECRVLLRTQLSDTVYHEVMTKLLLCERHVMDLMKIINSLYS